MTEKMVWDSALGKMVKVGKSKGMKSVERIALDSQLANTLKEFALLDGYDFTGVSYVTVKDNLGKTKHDKDGKPVFVMVAGKPKTETVTESVAKVHSAISDYVEVAVKALIELRNKKQ